MSALMQIKNVLLLATEINESDAQACLQKVKRSFPQVEQWCMLVYNKQNGSREQKAKAAKKSMEIICFTKRDLAFFTRKIKRQLLKPYVKLPVDVLIALNTDHINVFLPLIKRVESPFKVSRSQVDVSNDFNVFLPTQSSEGSASCVMTSVKSFFENIDKYE